MKQPKFSEVLRAAARGYMAPYHGTQQYMPQSYGGSMQIIGPFDSRDYATAKSVAGAFDALALLYEQYEAASPDQPEGEPR